MIADTTIAIPVDSETASRYSTASVAERRKVQMLVRLLLKETSATSQTMQQTMDAMSAEAQANGLTETILDDLLRDDA